MACQRTRQIILKLIILIQWTAYVAEKCPTGFIGSVCKKQNLAYNKSTSQSDLFQNHYSDLAVDGNTGPPLGTCSHTNTKSPSFWKVTLDDVIEYNITNIILFLSGKLANRYKDMTVEVDESLCTRINITNTDSEDPPIPNVVYVAGCDQHLMGKEVTVHAQSSYLTLCEVQIWSCVDTWFGFDCDKSCRCLNSSEICDKETGYCRSGCDMGWEGEGCQTACKNGTFGTCHQKCNCVNSTEICNKTSGACVYSGCKHGTYEPDCQTVCRDKSYGPNCSYPCGHCKDSSECNPETGVCSNGCEAGWKADKCDEEVTAPVSEPEPSSSLGGIIAGVVVAVLVLVVFGVGIIFYLRRRQVSKENKEEEGQIKEVHKVVEMNNLKGEGDEGHAPAASCRDNPYEATEPYYNNIPANIPLDNLKQHIRDKIAQGGFEEEFKMLPYGLHGEHEVGKKPENKKRNRFLNLFPYDHSRVKLIPEGDSTWDYINASFVTAYSDETTFIAAQGPNPATVDDFWRMVWQQNVRKIVMLTRLVEMDKKKCHKYWPEIDEKMQCGTVSVETTLVTVRLDFTIRKFKIQHTSSPSRTLTQFHFTTWPDHDVPAAPALVGFWKQVKYADTQTKEATGPTVIHCSAGVGRTGTFIALDSLVKQAETENKVNIFMCVGKMRRERMNMVQTVLQYQFVYEVLQEALESRGTFYTMSQFDQKYGLNFTYTPQQEEELKIQFESLQSLNISLTNNLVGDALSPENINKNRSKAIVPAKRNRPYLSTPVSGRNDYINAVMLPSPDRSSFFIVTQTPLPETVVDFWRLVYDHDCSTIVCLDESEDARSLYDCKKNVGPFHVETVSEDKSRDNYTFMKMKISRKKESKRDLEVYQLVSTDTTSFQQNTAATLELINVLNPYSIEKMKKCYDGSRLTGVFCTMMNIVSKLRLDKEVDIFLTIRELQAIRPQFIPTYDQYKLCHDMVKEYIRSANVYANM